MIWTAVVYSVSEEKIKCESFEAPFDYQHAYGKAIKDYNGIVLAIIKGNHVSGSYIPNLSLSLTRTKYRSEF